MLNSCLIDFIPWEVNCCNRRPRFTQSLEYVALGSSIAMISVYVFVHIFVFNCECLVTPNKQYIFELLVIEVTVKLYHQLLMLKQVPSLKLLVRHILSTIRENIYCVLDCNNLSDIKYFYPLIVTGIVGITDNWCQLNQTCLWYHPCNPKEL